MANLAFIYPNHSDEGLITPLGQPWQIPLTAAQDPRLSKVARSATTDPADTKFVVNLGEARQIGGIALVKHNISTSGRWRVEIGGDSGFTNIFYDSGWQEGWGVIYPWGSLPWGSPRWWNGKPGEQDRVKYPSMGLLLLQDGMITGQYLRVSIEDEANADGYIELARLYVGEMWQPRINASYGANLGWTTNTTARTARDGTQYFDRQSPLRVFNFSLDYLSKAEALGKVFEMQRQLDISEQLIFVFDPEDTENITRTSMLATIKTLTPISWPQWNNNAAAYQLQEAR